MTSAATDEIFAAQVENVRELERAWKHINRDINTAYQRSQDSAVRYETKILAIVYCALAEALFSKIIHSPHAFGQARIGQIKRASDENGVCSGWRKAIELALQRVDAKNDGYLKNVTQTIERFIDEYIFDPSVLRNKIAHGQWVKALNRENSAVNVELSHQIEQLDVVELYKRKEALLTLTSILEDLIKSPNKAHQKNYWEYLCRLEDNHKKMRGWTVEKKVRQLREKASHNTYYA